MLGGAGCGIAAPAARPKPTILIVGFGIPAAEAPQHGMQEAVRVIALEGLATFDRVGRPQPSLAESWSEAPDGLSWRIHLRPSVRFHDGKLLDASAVVDLLRRHLPEQMGPANADVSDIVADGDRDVLIRLNARSAFVPEALEIPLEESGHPGIGTGPFRISLSSSDGLEMGVNQDYYFGPSRIDRIVFKPYANLRAAWADMLRGRVDVLYDVDPDAFDLLQRASTVRVFEFPQHYAYIVVFNMRRPLWKDRRIRQALNTAIDRDRLIADGLQGHGVPAAASVWPEHWAHDGSRPIFVHDPALANAVFIAAHRGDGATQSLTTDRTRFSCLFPDAVPERLALGMQQQLQAFGIDMKPEVASLQEFNRKFTTGDFDAVLLAARTAPSLLRTYQWWHSGAPFNFGGFHSDAVDSALDAIRHSRDEATYKHGVAAFQQAIVDDPPAIFLAWSTRIRAVSNRFDVAPDPSGDVLKTLRLWRPIGDERMAGKN